MCWSKTGRVITLNAADRGHLNTNTRSPLSEFSSRATTSSVERKLSFVFLSRYHFLCYAQRKSLSLTVPLSLSKEKHFVEILSRYNSHTLPKKRITLSVFLPQYATFCLRLNKDTFIPLAVPLSLPESTHFSSPRRWNPFLFVWKEKMCFVLGLSPQVSMVTGQSRSGQLSVSPALLTDQRDTTPCWSVTPGLWSEQGSR